MPPTDLRTKMSVFESFRMFKPSLYLQYLEQHGKGMRSFEEAYQTVAIKKVALKKSDYPGTRNSSSELRS